MTELHDIRRYIHARGKCSPFSAWVGRTVQRMKIPHRDRIVLRKRGWKCHCVWYKREHSPTCVQYRCRERYHCECQGENCEVVWIWQSAACQSGARCGVLSAVCRCRAVVPDCRTGLVSISSFFFRWCMCVCVYIRKVQTPVAVISESCCYCCIEDGYMGTHDRWSGQLRTNLRWQSTIHVRDFSHARGHKWLINWPYKKILSHPIGCESFRAAWSSACAIRTRSAVKKIRLHSQNLLLSCEILACVSQRGQSNYCPSTTRASMARYQWTTRTAFQFKLGKVSLLDFFCRLAITTFVGIWLRRMNHYVCCLSATRARSYCSPADFCTICGALEAACVHWCRVVWSGQLSLRRVCIGVQCWGKSVKVHPINPATHTNITFYPLMWTPEFDNHAMAYEDYRELVGNDPSDGARNNEVAVEVGTGMESGYHFLTCNAWEIRRITLPPTCHPRRRHLRRLQPTSAWKRVCQRPSTVTMNPSQQSMINRPTMTSQISRKWQTRAPFAAVGSVLWLTQKLFCSVVEWNQQRWNHRDRQLGRQRRKDTGEEEHPLVIKKSLPPFICLASCKIQYISSSSSGIVMVDSDDVSLASLFIVGQTYFRKLSFLDRPTMI